MVHQFTAAWAQPKYWLEEQEARQALLGRRSDSGQELDYQNFRIGFRDIARGSDERTLIAALLPPRVFCNHKLPTAHAAAPDTKGYDPAASLCLLALMNSLVVDSVLRLKVAANLTFFLVNQTPVPRPQHGDPTFEALVSRSARLTCTTPEYADLWQEVMGSPWTPESGATDPDERGRLRAELDAIVAHLFALTEPELTHILATFPLVPQPTKDAVLAEFLAMGYKGSTSVTSDSLSVTSEVHK
jgi:hypothetical protein